MQDFSIQVNNNSFVKKNIGTDGPLVEGKSLDKNMPGGLDEEVPDKLDGVIAYENNLENLLQMQNRPKKQFSQILESEKKAGLTEDHTKPVISSPMAFDKQGLKEVAKARTLVVSGENLPPNFESLKLSNRSPSPVELPLDLKDNKKPALDHGPERPVRTTGFTRKNILDKFIGPSEKNFFGKEKLVEKGDHFAPDMIKKKQSRGLFKNKKGLVPGKNPGMDFKINGDGRPFSNRSVASKNPFAKKKVGQQNQNKSQNTKLNANISQKNKLTKIFDILNKKNNPAGKTNERPDFFPVKENEHFSKSLSGKENLLKGVGKNHSGYEKTKIPESITPNTAIMATVIIISTIVKP